jgi:hypothetical protein
MHIVIDLFEILLYELFVLILNLNFLILFAFIFTWIYVKLNVFA